MIERHDSLIVQRVSRFLIPYIQLFALYVFFHGHYSPGGGFQAGVLVGASIILKLLVGTELEKQKFSITTESLIACGGVAIFLGIGSLALTLGGNFFDYGQLAFLNDAEYYRRYYGILIAEIGVTMVVSMTLVIIFHILALSPDEEEPTGDNLP